MAETVEVECEELQWAPDGVVYIYCYSSSERVTLDMRLTPVHFDNEEEKREITKTGHQHYDLLQKQQDVKGHPCLPNW